MRPQIFRDRVFESRQDHDSGRMLSDLEFHNCRFLFCSLTVRTARRRQLVRRVRLNDCLADACHLGGVVLEEISVHTLRTAGALRISAAALKHVAFSGPVDRLLVHPAVWPGPATSEQQKEFDEANAAYYSNVDWALDIRDAEFGEVEIQGIPTNLIRRDPSTQVVVTREKALAGAWRTIDLRSTPWPGAIQFLIDDGYPAKILIAPKRSPEFDVLLEGLTRLRSAGVAEPN